MISAGPALVLQTYRFGEQGVVARLYTRQRGLVSFLVKGVYQRRSSKAALLQPMQQVQVVYTFRENKNLQQLSELKSGPLYHRIPFDAVRLAQLSFINELLAKSLRELEPDSMLYDFITDRIMAWDASSVGLPDFHLWFCLEYFRFLGIAPQAGGEGEGRYFSPSEGAFVLRAGKDTWNEALSAELMQLQECRFEDLAGRSSNRGTRTALLQSFLQYLEGHFPSLRDFQSPAVLGALFG